MPVSPDTATVNGYRVKPDSPAWQGLNWADVIMPDESQLSIGWMHPQDKDAGHAEDTEMWARYRVRPRREGYFFKAAPGKPIGWRLVSSGTR